jgi:hypothetical protein
MGDSPAERFLGWPPGLRLRYSKTADYILNLDAVRASYAEATTERFQHYIGNKRYGKDYGIQTLNP